MRLVSLLLALLGLTSMTSTRAIGATDVPFCPNRPGQTTPPCLVPAGYTMLEMSGFDWQRQRGDGARTDSWRIGQTLLRHGVSDRLELQLGWTPLGRTRTEARGPFATDTRTETGDLTLGFGLGTGNPAIEIAGFATLPSGDAPTGGSDWQAGLLIPFAVDLTERVSLGLTPGLAWVPDAKGEGHHPAWSNAAGIGFPLRETIGLGVDVAGSLDDDPDGASTTWTTSLSIGWQFAPAVQFDVGVVRGLDNGAPDLELYTGIAVLF